MNTTSIEVNLGNDLRVQDLQRRVWKALYDVADPIMVGMRGDLFEDARFLIDHLDFLPVPGYGEEFVFLWGVRSTGTDISTTDDHCLGTEWFECSRPYQVAVYTVYVGQTDRGVYFATFHPDNR